MSGVRKPDLGSIAIPRAAKGEAAPMPDVEVAKRAGEPSRDVADRGRGGDTREIEPPLVEPRSSASFRLTTALQERLRIASYRSRRSKQELVEEALNRLLISMGE